MEIPEGDFASEKDAWRLGKVDDIDIGQRPWSQKKTLLLRSGKTDSEDGEP